MSKLINRHWRASSAVGAPEESGPLWSAVEKRPSRLAGGADSSHHILENHLWGQGGSARGGCCSFSRADSLLHHTLSSFKNSEAHTLRTSIYSGDLYQVYTLQEFPNTHPSAWLAIYSSCPAAIDLNASDQMRRHRASQNVHFHWASCRTVSTGLGCKMKRVKLSQS